MTQNRKVIMQRLLFWTLFVVGMLVIPLLGGLMFPTGRSAGEVVRDFLEDLTNLRFWELLYLPFIGLVSLLALADTRYALKHGRKKE